MSELQATVEIDWEDDQPVPFVEVLYHVDLDRVGHSTTAGLFAENNNAVIIGRTWPDFDRRSLDDPCISRAQVGIVWLPKREVFRIEPCPGALLRTWHQEIGGPRVDIPLAGCELKPGSLVAIDDRLLLRVEYRIPAGEDRTFWGTSPAVERLRATMAERVRLGGSTWIEGGPGSGKKMVCRSMHERGERSEGPFVQLNCDELVDDKRWKRRLFGDADNAGLFREAAGGVLLLHRMEHLTKTMQESVANVVTSGRIKPVGVRKHIDVDTWCFGTIGRESLMDVPPSPELARAFGLAMISVPDLADYRSDVPTLFARYLKRTSERLAGVDRFWQTPSKEPGVIPMSFMLKLMEARWMGNVRQLQRLVVAIAKANQNQEGPFIEPEWPAGIELVEEATPTVAREALSAVRLRQVLEQHDYEMARVCAELGLDELEVVGKMKQFHIRDPASISLETLRDAKEETGDSLEAMADTLGVPAAVLARRIAELGIQL